MIKDGLIKYGTKGKDGEVFGNTAFADALMGAQEKQAKENVAKEVVVVTAQELLPDLDKIEVSETVLPSLEGNKEQIRVEAEGGRQWAEAAGAKIVQLKENIEKIQVEIRKIEKDPNSRFSPTAQNLMSQLKAAETRERGKLDQILSVKNDALKAHMEFSVLLEEIRGTDPSHLGEVRSIIGQMVKMGRYRVATPQEIEEGRKPTSKWPSGTIFFEGEIYFSIVSDAKSNGQRALEAEIRKLVDAVKMSKAATIKTRGNADLTSFELGKPGLYYLFSPKRTEGERKFYEGHALVELRDVNKGKFDIKDGKKVFRQPFVVVEVRDAIGSLARFVSDRWIPHYWIKQGKVITKEDRRLEQEEFDRAVRLIWTLRTLYGVWRKGLNPEAAKKSETGKAEVPLEGPAVNEVVDTDMTGIVVETKPATKPSAAEEKPKSKKVKKA